MNHSIKGSYCKVLCLLLLDNCVFSKSIAQNIASWYGRIILKEGKSIKQPNSSIEIESDNQIGLNVTLDMDNSWDVAFLFDAISGSFTGSNKSTQLK